MTSEVPVTPTNYGSNSKVSKQAKVVEEESKVEKIKIPKIEGMQIVEKKKGLGQRIRESFGGEDAKTVGQFIVLDVLLPGARDILFNIIHEGAHRSLYGASGGRRNSSVGSSVVGSVVRGTNYGSISTQGRIVGSGVRSAPTGPTQEDIRNFDFSKFAFPQRDQAEEVIERLSDAIDEFGVVTVADVFDFLGKTGNGFTDLKFGWDSAAFAGARVRPVHGAYILDIPRPLEIK